MVRNLDLFRLLFICALITGSGLATANTADEQMPTPAGLVCITLLKGPHAQVDLDQAVIDLFMVKARMGPVAAMGVQDRNGLRIVEGFAAVTGHDPRKVGQNLIDLGLIFEAGGAQRDLQMIAGLLAIAELYDVPVATTFESLKELTTLDAEAKIITNASDAIHTIKLSVVYGVPLKTVTDHLADLRKNLVELDARVAGIKKAEADQADPLAKALASMLEAVSGRSSRAGVDSEIIMALLESMLAGQGVTAEAAIKGYGELLSHERAPKYTIHEQVAMLKALLVGHQTIDESLQLLVALETKANEEFGGALGETFERPAVNLIFFANQTPSDVLGFIKAINENHSNLERDDAAFIMNRVFNMLSSSPMARSARLFGF